jgi:ribose 1,5-bisphosphokinase PhnN
LTSTENDDFWSARPILAHIHQFARSRRRCPWAVLGVSIVRANGIIPPATALPPYVGGRASLNTFVALTGPSGAGKGTSEAAARDAISFRWDDGQIVDLPEFPIGSGEGIARTFMSPATGKDGEPEREQIYTAVFSVPEVDTAAGLFSRSGSTLEGELRKVFSGEQLGFTNAQAHTRTRVPAHTYRCGLIVGVQPGRAGALLDGADGGTPQRFVWLPVLDADMPDERPDEPPPVTIDQPKFSGDLTVPDVARAAVDAHQLAMHRGTVDPLDGHRLLVRLKVAAALMVLDGRNEAPVITAEDWDLAGTVMAMSDHTRAWVQRERADAARRANRGRALATAERDEIISDSKLNRAKQAILRKLGRSVELPTRELRYALKADIRDNFTTALTELADESHIIAIEVPGGTRYRLSSEVHAVPEVHAPKAQVKTREPEVPRVPTGRVTDLNSHRSHENSKRTTAQPPTSESTEEPVKTVGSKVCQRCFVSLPLAATGPLCDECIDAPDQPVVARDATKIAPGVVVHNGATPYSYMPPTVPLSKLSRRSQ